MALHQIKKGLNVPISGEATQGTVDIVSVHHVALRGPDYVGMKPNFAVEIGDKVLRGQLLFEDKKMPGVRFTSPGAGKVVGIHRGYRRMFESIVIELTGTEAAGQPAPADFKPFETYKTFNADNMKQADVRALLVESGLWTALRQRPFGRVANPEETPAALFVTAIDTNPLAADPGVALRGRDADWALGLSALRQLTEGQMFVCTAPDADIDIPDGVDARLEEFEGPHPAGLVGTHIERLCPVSRKRFVWHIGYQDVLAVGELIRTGHLPVERVVSLAGPGIHKPRIVRTRLGAFIDEIVAAELEPGKQRVVSGSILSGRAAMGKETGFLGRYHNQISALADGEERTFMSWAMPGFNRFSSIPTFLSALKPRGKFDMTTMAQGSKRAMVPIGMYEAVMPLDILATFLLRALLTEDIEKAEKLGVLELEEEDLALCTFVCPSKIDYGGALREMLTVIEKEG